MTLFVLFDAFFRNNLKAIHQNIGHFDENLQQSRGAWRASADMAVGEYVGGYGGYEGGYEWVCWGVTCLRPLLQASHIRIAGNIFQF